MFYTRSSCAGRVPVPVRSELERLYERRSHVLAQIRQLELLVAESTVAEPAVKFSLEVSPKAGNLKASRHA
jgi:hypothetical protein